MKKVMMLIMLCLTAGLSVAVQADNFDSYTKGQIDAVTGGAWVSTKASTNTATLPISTMVIAADPTDALNQVLLARPSGGQCGLYGVLTGNEIVADGSTKTMSLKFRVNGTTYDRSFGLTTLDEPKEFGNTFNVQCALISGTFRARNGGTTSGSLATIAADTWYYLWVVVDNAANTYDIYLKSTATSATASDLIADNYAFRTVTPDGDLDRFFVMLQLHSVDILFDDINISNGTNLSLVGPAFNPSPSAGQTNVATDADLSWSTGLNPADPVNPNPAITKHYVYLREGDPNMKNVTPVIVSAGSPVSATASLLNANLPVALAMDKTYYWRVDESVNNSSPSDANTIQGGVWAFSTQKSIPEITQQPVEQRVLENSTAVLTVKFSSISPASITWKKVVDGINDLTIIAGTSWSEDAEGYTATLTFAPLTSAGEGQYYCLLSNPGTYDPLLMKDVPVQSNKAVVIANRLLAQYPFENDLSDAVGDIDGIGKNVDPNFASSIPTFVSDSVEGSYAVSLSGLGQYVDFGTQAFPRASMFANGVGAGLDTGTITCWVKAQSPNGLLANYNDGYATGFAFTVETNSDARINVRGETLAGAAQEIGTAQGRPSTGFNMINDGKWHLVTSTWGQGAGVTVYVDGAQMATGAGVTPERYQPWQRGVLLGASRSGTNREILNPAFYGGLVDDLRIFNYRLTPEAIAQEYFEETGIRVCLNPAFSGSSFNFDNTGSSYCKIDLADFAKFAEGWMSTGLYPASY